MPDDVAKLAALKPAIRIVAGDLAPIARRAEDLLVEVSAELYQRGGLLVRPIVETVDATHDRTTQVAQLKVVTPGYLRYLLAELIDWQRYDGRRQEEVRVDPPTAIANTIIERAGHWPFLTVSGIISTPTMRPDGSLLTEPGYDPQTRLLLLGAPAVEVLERPTRDDALTALALLKGLLSEFPFTDDRRRSGGTVGIDHARRARGVPGGATACLSGADNG